MIGCSWMILHALDDPRLGRETVARLGRVSHYMLVFSMEIHEGTVRETPHSAAHRIDFDDEQAERRADYRPSHDHRGMERVSNPVRRI